MSWREYQELELVEATALVEALEEMIAKSNATDEVVSQPRDFRR